MNAHTCSVHASNLSCVRRMFGASYNLFFIYFENSENVELSVLFFILIKETFARYESERFFFFILFLFFTNWKTLLSKYREVNFFAIEYIKLGIFAYNATFVKFF